MGTCMSMGQAAGTAAALAAAAGVVPGGLDAGRLREHLAEQGVLLDPVLPDGG
jgi:hypothetical protein